MTLLEQTNEASVKNTPLTLGDQIAEAPQAESQSEEEVQIEKTYSEGKDMVLSADEDDFSQKFDGANICLETAESTEEWSELFTLINEFGLWKHAVWPFIKKCPDTVLRDRMMFEFRFRGMKTIEFATFKDDGDRSKAEAKSAFAAIRAAEKVDDEEAFDRIGVFLVENYETTQQCVLKGFREKCPEDVYSEFRDMFLDKSSEYVSKLSSTDSEDACFRMHVMLDVCDELAVPFIERYDETVGVSNTVSKRVQQFVRKAENDSRSERQRSGELTALEMKLMTIEELIGLGCSIRTENGRQVIMIAPNGQTATKYHPRTRRSS